MANWLLNVVLTIQWAADNLIRMIGPLFVLLALGLISSVVYVWSLCLLPMHAKVYSLQGFCRCVVAVWLVTNIFFNYVQCIRTSPGYTDSSLDEVDCEEAKPEPGKGGARYCKKCKRVKPVRAHHCHVCRRCVLKMDHHCPWVNNCVGFYNHRYFFLFLLYLWLGCGYIALLSMNPFYDRSAFRRPWPYPVQRSSVVFCFVLTVSIMLALSFMMFWHLYLILSSQTTIEFYFNRFNSRQATQRGEVFRNPFDLGMKRNAELFFGYAGNWHMILLPSTDPPPGDGITYETIHTTQQ